MCALFTALVFKFARISAARPDLRERLADELRLRSERG